MKQREGTKLTNTAENVRQARDDMKTSIVKRNAVAAHDSVSRLTPSLYTQWANNSVHCNSCTNSLSVLTTS